MDSYIAMSGPAAAVMYDEMLSHEWLTGDQTVQKTTFSSGVEIQVNFDEIEREGMSAKSYRVTGIDGGKREGSFGSHWIYS